MVEFDELERGKWYIKVDTGLNYSPYNKNGVIEKIFIIGKGTYFPINYNNEDYNNEVDTTRSYDAIFYLDKNQEQGRIDNYRDVERYHFFDVKDNIKKEIKDLVEAYKNRRLYELEQKVDSERLKIFKEVEQYKEHLSQLIKDKK